MRTTRYLATAGLAACLSLAIVGCGNDKPVAAPPPATTDSATPSATPTPTTPGTILGYTPKTDDEREILEQYDAFGKMAAIVQTYPREKRAELMAPTIDQKFINAVMWAYDGLELNKGQIRKGEAITVIKTIKVNGDKAEMTACVDGRPVQYLKKDTNEFVKTDPVNEPNIITMIKNSDDVWRVLEIRVKGSFTCP